MSARKTKPICRTCRDTHRMVLDDRDVPCTHCPTPCEECRGGWMRAYCREAPCPCTCHNPAQRIPRPMNECDKARAEGYASGFAAGKEEAAKVATRRAEETQAILDRGKGEWPKTGYVRDETWASLNSDALTARSIASAILALPLAPPAPEGEK